MNTNFINMFENDDIEDILNAFCGDRMNHSIDGVPTFRKNNGYRPVSDNGEAFGHSVDDNQKTHSKDSGDALDRQISETNRMSDLYMKATKRISYLENENAAYKKQLEAFSSVIQEYKKKLDLISKLCC